MAGKVWKVWDEEEQEGHTLAVSVADPIVSLLGFFFVDSPDNP